MGSLDSDWFGDSDDKRESASIIALNPKYRESTLQTTRNPRPLALSQEREWSRVQREEAL
jgi:hypothetical protein